VGRMWLVLSAAFAGTRCDADALQEGVEALRVIDEQHASELATAVLSEGCKLPGPLGEALEAVPQVSPDHRALFDAKMVAEAPELWVAACAGGVPVVVQTSQVAPIDKRRLLWAGCELIGLGAFTEAEWTAAPGLLYAPSCSTSCSRTSEPSPRSPGSSPGPWPGSR